LHPDKFVNNYGDEKAVSAYYSSLLNQAYAILQSPLSRGFYLLELEGYPLLEDRVTLEHNLISEIMELNEEIDTLDNLGVLAKIKESNLIEIDNLIDEVSGEFLRKNWKAAQICMGKLKFYFNIKEKIKKKEQQLREQIENKPTMRG